MVLDERARGAHRRDRRAPLHGRWPDVDREALRAANRKQAVIPAGATVLEPRGNGAGAGRAAAEGRRRPDGRGAARAARRAAADVGRRRRDRRRSSARSPARPTTGARSCGCSGSPRPRSRTRCEPPMREGLTLAPLEITTCLRRGEIEISHALRARGAGGLRRAASTSSPSATASACSRATAARSTSRSRGLLAERDDRGGRVLHGRPAGRPADRARRAPRRTCSAGPSSTATRPRSIWSASIPA